MNVRRPDEDDPMKMRNVWWAVREPNVSYRLFIYDKLFQTITIGRNVEEVFGNEGDDNFVGAVDRLEANSWDSIGMLEWGRLGGLTKFRCNDHSISIGGIINL